MMSDRNNRTLHLRALHGRQADEFWRDLQGSSKSTVRRSIETVVASGRRKDEGASTPAPHARQASIGLFP